MRVTAGRLKGRRIQSPPGQDVRPTTDKVREAIFSILAHEVPDAAVLDLFAGAGTLGIEALSRGARSVVFVEKAPRAVRILSENLSQLELSARTLEVDWLTALDRLAGENARFDLVFADPPYRTFSPADIVQALDRSSLLAPEGVLIIEADAKAKAELALKVLKRRTFGQTQVIFCASSGGADDTNQ